ncbi:MAG: hypothetical protein IJJ99_02300 [Oscillospiraceae bacterium]|nr:hypothetical protein [Oscillospiraceae bacterium]
MKKWLFFGAICIVLLLLLISLFLYFCNNTSVPVDNERTLSEIQTCTCSIKEMLLAEAIFNVRDDFEDVDAAELAHDAGLKLECRRQTAPNEFYYAIGYGTYRCFVFTDANNIVDRVLYCTEFRTIADIQKEIDQVNAAGLDFYTSNEYGLAEIGIELGNFTGGYTREYILADGVLIVETPFMNGGDETTYHFFTDEEWSLAREQWGGYIILPIDKQNQSIA